MKIKLVFQLLVLGMVTGVLSSCNDIIEPSVTNSKLYLEAPADGFQSTSYAINFWWDPVDHALSYRLQVVSPNFASPAKLVLDTIITHTRFTFNLNPGNFQWRVLAQNGSSQTAFTAPRAITVSASSIKQQAVQLTYPANNFITSQGTVVFQWGNLYGATGYRFEIDTNNFVNEALVISNQLIPGQQISFTFPKEQIYQWRIRAENDTAQAQWSAVNSVTYDHTPPAKVTLVAPVSGKTVGLPVSLQWNPVTSAMRYKVYVFKNDSTSLYSQNFPLSVTATSYTFNAGSAGDKVYWKVTALDAAGNESQASDLRSFILQ